MSIISKTFGLMGQDGVTPRRVQMVVTDNATVVQTRGYLSNEKLNPDVVYPTDIFDIIYSWNSTTHTGTYGEFLPTITAGVITLTLAEGNVVLPTTANAIAVFTNTTGELSDNLPNATNAVTTSSATPGVIRSIIGSTTGSSTTMTSGNLVGVRGVTTLVGASGGFLYGVQGKVIASGTLSGSSWTAGLFGQLDISAATINAGQTAPVWADYGTTSGTITSGTGMRLFAGTNTTAAVLNAQVYLYGGATNLFELDTNSGGVGPTYVTSGGSGGLSGTIKKLAITIDSVTYYIPCATVVS